MKTTWMTMALVVVAGWTAMIAFGEDLKPVSKVKVAAGSKAPSIEHLIRQLGDESPERRQEAERVLGRLGDRVSDALKKAMEESDQPEIRHRCHGLLQKIQLGKMFDRVEAVNGLKCIVEANDVQVRIGQTVRIRSRLLNVADHPIKLQVGYSTCGNYFECGSVIKSGLLALAGETKPVKPSWRVGFCGTGAYPLKQVLMPGQMVVFETPVQFVSQPGVPQGKPRGIGAQLADGLKFGKRGYLELNLEGAESVTLSMAHAVKGKEGFGFRGRPFQPKGSAGPDPAGTVWWNGAFKPNQITLKLDRSKVGSETQANKG